jgi:multidrug resistance efflux pump
MRVAWWLCVLLLGAACARSAPAHRRAEEAPTGMAFTSSLAVLLEHRGELALTPEQVTRFEQMDFTLREKNRALQQQLESLREANKKGTRPWHGGYLGGGSHDVHGGKGGSMSGPADADQQKLQRRARLTRIESTLREMQDNDTQAYLQAEGLMTDAQKPRARELFSEERDTLLKQLDAMHYQLRKGDY